MIVHLSGDVDYSMLDKLVKEFNCLTKADNLHIYFTCPQGGLTDVGIAMIDFINKNSDYIGMSFYGELFSAGMSVFLAVTCSKKVLPDTRGMYHFSWQEMSINEAGKPSGEYDIFSMKEMKKAKDKTIEFLKNTKLNDKEISLIKKGKDVYFSHERMKELI